MWPDDAAPGPLASEYNVGQDIVFINRCGATLNPYPDPVAPGPLASACSVGQGVMFIHRCGAPRLLRHPLERACGAGAQLQAGSKSLCWLPPCARAGAACISQVSGMAELCTASAQTVGACRMPSWSVCMRHEAEESSVRHMVLALAWTGRRIGLQVVGEGWQGVAGVRSFQNRK